jgi:predicted nuclease of restriction endonuclease-like (RecB) superfamily
LRAALTLNQETIQLYWSIGQDLSSRFAAEGWGTKVVDRLAKDSARNFPGWRASACGIFATCGPSPRRGPPPKFLQLAAKLPWGHHMVLLDRLKDGPSREWYLRASIEYGWSRNVLTHHISTRLREREGKALTNFSRTLPAEESDLTQQILKDPYSFEFLTLSSTARERELERGLLKHLRDLLLELGRGFSFVGSQVPLEVGGETFYIDLLFYHLRLHCYFVIELKSGKFKPEWAGKLNFHLSAVDDLFRNGPDAPTIGLLLCETRNSALAEYALRDVAKPIGVSTYRVTRELPAPVRDELRQWRICRKLWQNSAPRCNSCGRSGRMNNFVWPITESRIVVTLSQQLCNELLHNRHLTRVREVSWQ